MRIAQSAWCDVDTTTIRNCWRKAGILPEMPTSSSHAIQPSIPISYLLHDVNSESQMDPLAHTEKQVKNALDNLQSRGVLHQDNRMDIESLLNPQNEVHIMTEASNKDIYQAVMDAVEAHENLEKNGEDDVDDDGPIKPCPSHQDVLKAVSTIVQYVSVRTSAPHVQFYVSFETDNFRYHSLALSHVPLCHMTPPDPL